MVDIPERARLDQSARRTAQESLKDILAAAGAGDGSREATLEELREADAAAREVLRGGVVVEVEEEEEEEEEEEKKKKKRGEFDYIMDYQVEVGTMGGLTPLLHAVREGNIEAAVALLDGGADLEGAAGDGTTPLLMAALNGHFDLAQDLLGRGSDANVVDSRGVTPLYGRTRPCLGTQDTASAAAGS